MNKPKAPRLVTVAIFTTITIIFWVFFSLYIILTTKPSTIVDPKLLEPINPELDREALGKLNDRVNFEEADIKNPFTVPLNLSITQTTPVPTETVTEETEEENPPESTESASVGEF